MRRALVVAGSTLVLAVMVAASAACSRVEEPDASSHATSPSASVMSATSAPIDAAGAPSVSPIPSTAPLDPFGKPPASASASSSADALASTAFDGTWVFERFDLEDPATAAKWSAIPADAQADVLANAPQATLVISKGTIVTKLAGVPDKRSTFTVVSSTSGNDPKEIVIATSDEGKKRLRLLPYGAMRVEDLDKKDSFVTIFVPKMGPKPIPKIAPKE